MEGKGRNRKEKKREIYGRGSKGKTTVRRLIGRKGKFQGRENKGKKTVRRLIRRKGNLREGKVKERIMGRMVCVQMKDISN